MSRKVDWYYHRGGWTSCGKAQEFLAKHNVEVAETVSASAKLGSDDALRLARAAMTVTVAKGKRVTEFSMKKDPPDDATLLSHLLGPTGNLRAPTIRKGRVLIVGFDEDAYRKLV